MFDDNLDLSEVMRGLKRADDALTECIAPLWSGAGLVAAWMEGQPRLYRLDAPPAHDGFYLLATDGDRAVVAREAEADEMHRYLRLLPTARVVLLEDGLAYPATFAERLQGITGPWPIHFTLDPPLTTLTARFDGLNLYAEARAAEPDNPLAGLFGESSIFAPGSLLDVPGGNDDDARAAQDILLADPSQAVTARLHAILTAAGATLTTWSRADGAYIVRWERYGAAHETRLTSTQPPITAGISLPGARTFDAGKLARFLLDHALDLW
jgi:hypothetical protein